MKKLSILSAAIVLSLAAPAFAGWQNGPSLNGVGSNGIATNGLGANGIGSNGIGSNGLASNGIGSNGIGSNGLGSNGASQNRGTPAPTPVVIAGMRRGTAPTDHATHITGIILKTH